MTEFNINGGTFAVQPTGGALLLGNMTRLFQTQRRAGSRMHGARDLTEGRCCRDQTYGLPAPRAHPKQVAPRPISTLPHSCSCSAGTRPPVPAEHLTGARRARAPAADPRWRQGRPPRLPRHELLCFQAALTGRAPCEGGKRPCRSSMVRSPLFFGGSDCSLMPVVEPWQSRHQTSTSGPDAPSCPFSADTYCAPRSHRAQSSGGPCGPPAHLM